MFATRVFNGRSERVEAAVNACDAFGASDVGDLSAWADVTWRDFAKATNPTIADLMRAALTKPAEKAQFGGGGVNGIPHSFLPSFSHSFIRSFRFVCFPLRFREAHSRVALSDARGVGRG